MPPIDTQLSAKDLVTPPANLDLQTLKQPELPESPINIAKNVARDTNGFLTAQTKEAEQLRQLEREQNALLGGETLGQLQERKLADLGVPKDLQELKDIQLQLADMDTESAVQQQRIAGAGGQTVTQGGREITLQQKENAIRQMGLAARASVLQGNIETATNLVNSAVATATSDRQFALNNLINQINQKQKQVDSQTAQLLEQDKRAYEAELKQIQDLKDAVNSAMESGSATSKDIQILTNPNISDEEKKALAQTIISRSASEMRNLDIAQKEASITASRESALTSRTNRIIDLAERGDQEAINQLGFDPRKTTGNFEAESSLRKEFNTLPTVKEAQSVQQSYRAIFASNQEAMRAQQAGTSSSAADQALIISFNKMLDPTSVVREGEFARSTEGQSYLQQLQAKVDQAMRGGAGLSAETRQALVETTEVLYGDYIKTHNDKAYQYRQNALRQGGDPTYVAGYLDTTNPPEEIEEGGVMVLNGQPYIKQEGKFILLDI